MKSNAYLVGKRTMEIPRNFGLRRLPDAHELLRRYSTRFTPYQRCQLGLTGFRNTNDTVCNSLPIYYFIFSENKQILLLDFRQLFQFRLFGLNVSAETPTSYVSNAFILSTLLVRFGAHCLKQHMQTCGNGVDKDRLVNA